jgi:hypothetical protein
MDQISTVFNEDILKNHFSVKRYILSCTMGKHHGKKAGSFLTPPLLQNQSRICLRDRFKSDALIMQGFHIPDFMGN